MDAIIFDFDGVITESVDIKTDAFLELYENHPAETKDRIRTYHLKHSGVSRYKKIRYFESHILGKESSEEKINQLAKKFQDIVLDEVVKCRFVKGSLEFLREHHNRIDFHIATGTPEIEMKTILNRKNIAHFFMSVNGSPKTKDKIICGILEKYNYDRNQVLFVGDATADYQGAKSNKIRFIGRVPPGEKSPFNQDQVVIHDLTKLEECINSVFWSNDENMLKQNNQTMR